MAYSFTKKPKLTLSDDEWYNRCDNLFSPYKDLPYIPTSLSNISELFFLWNDRFTPYEAPTSCGSCKKRVYKNLRTKYEQERAKR